MFQITMGDIEVANLLKKYDYNDMQHRIMKYVYECKIENGWLILNGLTQVLILVDFNEYQTFYDSEFAVQNYFAVPLDYDEYNIVKELRLIINEQIYKQENQPSKYTIYTTTACNARCDYCFERGAKAETMSLDICGRVVDCIVRFSGDTNEKITLHWFGGEPLLNTKVIDCICDGLSEQGIRYHSIMTTNGLCLNKKLIEYAKEAWQLDLIKITLDGTEDVYNRTKAYIGNVHNAYVQVLENIRECLLEDIYVEIRLNVSEENGSDLIELVDDLTVKMENCEKFNMYCCPMMKRDEKGVCRRTEKENKILEKNYLQLQKHIFKCGFYKDRVKTTLWTRRCSAERESEITILPNGNLGICLLYLDDYIIGNIDSNSLNRSVVDSFKIHYEELAKCRECILFPQCFRLKNCKFDIEYCPIGATEVALEILYEQMKYEYEVYKREKWR